MVKELTVFKVTTCRRLHSVIRLHGEQVYVVELSGESSQSFSLHNQAMITGHIETKMLQINNSCCTGCLPESLFHLHQEAKLHIKSFPVTSGGRFSSKDLR